MDQLAGILPVPLAEPDAALERQFEAGLAQWGALAFRVTYSVLRQREDAEDVAQDVLAKAYRSLSQLRSPKGFKAWLVRMAWRLALNRRKSEERRRRREEYVGDALTWRTENHALSVERLERLWSAIDGLPTKLRIVVVLASIQEHDLSHVASVLAIPEGTVKSRLSKARRLLRERLT